MRNEPINSADDVRFSILVFLKNQSSPSIEISNIKAGRDISIAVDKFFHRSPDFLELQAQVDRLRSQLASLPVSELNARQEAGNTLQRLTELKKAFKIDVLQLADIFLRLHITSERLDQAKTLFEEGRFKAASAILAEEDLTSDQENLLLAADYWEYRKASLLEVLAIPTGS